jgi:hypothetical protein
MSVCLACFNDHCSQRRMDKHKKTDKTHIRDNPTLQPTKHIDVHDQTLDALFVSQTQCPRVA